MTRFQRLAVATTTATFLLIAVGGLVRATDSGLGCPDWPRCFGKLTPPPNLHAWIEHSHRLVAAVVIVLVALTVVVAWRTKQSRAIRWASIGALAMVIAQAILGAIVVWAKLEAESVTLHLATALALVALMEFITFRSRWGLADRSGRSRRFVRLAMVGAGLTYAQMLVYGAGLVLVQIALGVANVANRLSALTVVPHLAVGSLLWGTMFALVLHADRFAGATGRDQAEPAPAPDRTTRESLTTYFLLTKPRIIELLLITTVPTMFLAKRGVPSPLLILTTLFGGSLSAASANVINCYLDRDIDERMRRTRRRPLPAHQVAASDALRFGLVLGVAGFVWLWATVNLLSAALATAAILFYVFVYTLGLKRRSTQNIVIGGAAGAVPVLVGWTAVTGRIELPALVLFAIIFYWTPPHFWALSLRYREDYEAAGVPMLPVVRGPKETSHQILYYTLLLVAVTLLMYPAGQMGVIYLVAALALGGVFVWRAVGLARDVSGKRAIRLFSFSNQYLALLFLAMAIDAVMHVTR